MSTRYRLKVPIRAILDRANDKLTSVEIPAGAILTRHGQLSDKPALLGLVSVSWGGRQYSVSLNDLIKKAEVVQSA